MNLTRCGFLPVAAALVLAGCASHDQPGAAAPTQNAPGVANQQAVPTESQPTGAPGELPAAAPPENTATGSASPAAPVGATNLQSPSSTTNGDTAAPSTLAVGPGNGLGLSEADLSSMSDAQLVAIFYDLNDEETRLAQYAESNAMRPDVKRFAHDMVVSRIDMQDKDNALMASLHVSPAKNPLADRFGADFRQQMTTLEGARGQSFDKQYLDAEISGQTKLVEGLDRIIPHFHNEKVADEVTACRTRIEAHLHMARDLERKPGTSAPAVP
jgi:predicted outer membrane protein